MADPVKINIRNMKALEAQAESLRRIEARLGADDAPTTLPLPTSTGAEPAGKEKVKSHG